MLYIIDDKKYKFRSGLSYSGKENQFAPTSRITHFVGICNLLEN